MTQVEQFVDLEVFKIKIFNKSLVLETLLISNYINVIIIRLFVAGVSNFASSSSHFGPSAGSDGLSDFEFKDQQQPNIGLGYDTAGAADTSGSETGYQSIWTYPPDNNVNAITASYGSSSNNK